MGLLTLLDSLAHRVLGRKRRFLTLAPRAHTFTLEERDVSFTVSVPVRPLTLRARTGLLYLERRTIALTIDLRMT